MVGGVGDGGGGGGGEEGRDGRGGWGVCGFGIERGLLEEGLLWVRGVGFWDKGDMLGKEIAGGCLFVRCRIFGVMLIGILVEGIVFGTMLSNAIIRPDYKVVK